MSYLRLMVRMWSCLVLIGLTGLSLSVQAQSGRCDDTVPLIEQYAGARVVTDTPNNVRETPSVDGELQGQIPPQGIFLVVAEPVCAEGYTWYEIYYRPEEGETIQGWTAAAPADSAESWIVPVSEEERPLVPGIVRYREDEYIPQIENATPVIGDVVRVSIVPEGDTLNLRDEPDTSGAVVAELAHGAVLDVLDGPVESDSYRWWQVRTANGTVGYVSDTFRPANQVIFIPTLIPRCPYADSAGNRLLTFATLDTIRDGEVQERGSSMTSILTMAPDGSQRCRIAFAAPGSGLDEPAWTSDGQSVLYIFEKSNQSIGGAYNGDTYIYQLAADGIQQTLLAPGRKHYRSLAMSPTGSEVFYYYRGNPDSIWRVGLGDRNNTRLFTGSMNVPFHLVDDRVYFLAGLEGVTYDEGSDYNSNIVWMDRDTLDVFSLDGTTRNIIPIPGSNDVLYYEDTEEDSWRLMRFIAAENRSVELSFNRDHKSNLIGLMPDQAHYLRIGWNRLNPDESPGEYDYAYFLEDVETGDITQITPYEYEARARSPYQISPDGQYLSTHTGVFNLETGEFTPLENAGSRGIWRPVQTGD